MKQSLSFFPSLRAAVSSGVAVAALLTAGIAMPVQAQTAASQTTAPQQSQQPLVVSAPGQVVPQTKAEKRQAAADKKAEAKAAKAKDAKVVQSKDTRAQQRKLKKGGALVGQDANLPDKQLYDKATKATKHGHFDVARLDLQTLLNTYPDSQYQMRAKLAIADSWYKEGGTAALTQAESEYKDFITFFPNVPEAAEAQMRVGDIYFRQMDKPDRDYAKAVHAEEEYRTMLQQFPDSTLVPDAKQRLREVQEVLANRETSIAAFYATHANWAASIARYQTVIDTYPQYSHMDDALIGLGDAYSAEAKFVRGLKLPEAGKARLEHVYDDAAAAAYSKVVLEHSASPHVEDARDRLAEMHMPIPKPTPDQVAASETLENSRAQYRLSDRARLLVLHTPDVVSAARTGDPTLADPPPTLAPDITRTTIANFNAAMNPKAGAPVAPTPNAAADTASSAAAAPAAAPAAPAAPLALEDVPTAESGDSGNAAAVTSVPGSGSGAATPGASAGIEIVAPTSTPAADNSVVKAVGPPDSSPLPAIEKPAGAPDQINDVATVATPGAQAAPANGKKVKPAFNGKDESSSKHKKKKGLDKLNPF